MSWLPHDQYAEALDMLAALRVRGRAFCRRFELGRTHEGRAIEGLHVHGLSRTEGEVRGVLVVGGAHAREMVPPEAVLRFADEVCRAYVSRRDISFGGKTYPASIARVIVDALDLYLVPLLNPDGRAFVESTNMSWRKNRRPGRCRGVDLNRNHDFLFTSGVASSDDPCNFEAYRGPRAHSEPETAALRDFLDSKPHIAGVLDLHSVLGRVLYPWAIDEHQTSDPTMSFLDPAWDGQRGTRGDRYREYIAAPHLAFYQTTAARVRDRIREVAGRAYLAQPWVDMYPAAGTLHDYSYSRHRTSTTRPTIMSMTIELGFVEEGFRPEPESLAQTVRNEGAVGALEFCLAIVCAGDVLLRATAMAITSTRPLRNLRRALVKSPGGAQHVASLERFGGELVRRFAERDVAEEIVALIEIAIAWSRSARKLDKITIERARRLLARLRKGASKELKAALDAARADLSRIDGKTITAALTSLRGGGRSAQRSSLLAMRSRTNA